MSLIFLKILRKKFGIKIFALFTIFTFVISFAFTAFFIHHESRSLTDTLIKKGKLLAKILAHNSRIGVFSENEELLKDPVDGIFQQEGVLEVLVFNMEGKLLKKEKRPGISPHKIAVKDNKRSRIKIFEQLKATLSPFYFEDDKTLKFWSPVISGSRYSMEESLYFEEEPSQPKDRVIGFVRIMVDKELLNKQLNDLLLKGIMIGLIFLAVGSGVIYLMAKGITRPLNRLIEGVKTLGRGGVVKRVPVETKDEIGRLAHAFNTMYKSLKRREAEKQQLEEQLRHAQKLEAIGTLAGGIAHDFNNILTVIQSSAQLISMDLDSAHPHYELVEEIEARTQIAAHLTQQLLGFARGGKYEIKIFNLNDEVQASATAFGRTKKEINIHFNLQEDLPPIQADVGQIEQVLINLYVNAAQAMPDGGDIFLETRIMTNKDIKGKHFRIEPGNYILLSVKDTGLGMDKETQARIFEPFFTTRRMGRGTGLGLASVYGIIKSHKGHIEVESQLGRGTTFKIYLPVSKKKITEPAKTARKMSTGTETILVVDDEDPVLKVSVRALHRMGYTVLEAKGGHEAVEIYKANKDKIDLVILDMVMPDMGGGKVYDRLKAINQDIKVLLCSGYSIDGQASKILERGCNGFLQKPFDMKELSGRIREIVEKG